MHLIPRLLYLSLFSLTVIALDGTSSELKADSRVAFGGRAAEMSEHVSAQIVADAENDGYFLLAPQTIQAPAAGENTAGKALDDPYFDNWDDDDFDSYSNEDIADPLEPWNRFWYGFNDILWRQYAQPIWQTYELITPKEFRQGVSNFFDNIAFPVRFINCLLQGKPLEAGVEFQRFIMNTALGFGGLMNPGASSKPLWCDEPDVVGFGQTLGRWGVGDGFYIVWPIIGPSTARESVGLLGDFAANPMSYTTLFWENRISNTALALRTNHSIGEGLESYNSMIKISVEPYSALRNAYIQSSRTKVTGLEKPDE